MGSHKTQQCVNSVKTGNITTQRFYYIILYNIYYIIYIIYICIYIILYNIYYIYMVLKLGRSGQQIRNAWKVLKCGAGEG